MHYCQQAVCYNAGRMPAESSVGFSSVHTRANICETPHYSKPPTVVANVKETLHYYENKRINDNINFSFIWISKL